MQPIAKFLEDAEHQFTFSEVRYDLGLIPRHLGREGNAWFTLFVVCLVVAPRGLEGVQMNGCVVEVELHVYARIHKGWSLVYAQYLRLRPGLVTPYIVEMSVAHRVALYTTEKSQVNVDFCLSHKVMMKFCQTHRGFFGVVTRSQPSLSGRKF